MNYSHVINRMTPRVGAGLAGHVRQPTSHGIEETLNITLARALEGMGR